jgi:2-oxo-4-hydroxy-4-carboxy-5-ureidoimidazoline decarboxylase
MCVEWINTTSVPELDTFFRRCCTCETWIKRMVAGRPYNSRDSVLKTADANWQGLDESDYLQAFEGHPMIGDIHSLQTRYADTRSFASDEQSRVNSANHETLEALMAANAEYKIRFGFVFIVCATGKSAEEILTVLHARLGKTKDEELRHAAQEQCKITRIRLEKLL